MNTTTVVVTGATGSVGGQVVAQLAGRGLRVRAVGRDPATIAEVARRHGAEPVVGDLADPADPAGLAPALEGADAAFLVFPSVVGDAHAAETVAALAGAVPRIVYLSSMGVDGNGPRDEGAAEGDVGKAIMASHARLEGLLRAQAREWTFLRASGFATNTLGWADQIRAGDDVRWFGPDITRTLVHEADLAAVGVRAMLDDGHAGAIHDLTGPEQLTQVAQLAALGAALDRPLRFVDIGAENAPELFAGMPPEVARSLVRAQLAMAETPEPLTGEVERLLGRPATPYAQWARDHVAAFR